MVDFSKISKEEKTTHLFVSMHDVDEIRWLLDKAGISKEECYLEQWNMVLRHHVKAIKDISDEEREAEIDLIYGKDEAAYVKHTPAVLISHYNVKELIKALHDTLFGEGDADYNAFSKKRQSEIDADDIDDL